MHIAYRLKKRIVAGTTLVFVISAGAVRAKSPDGPEEVVVALGVSRPTPTYPVANRAKVHYVVFAGEPHLLRVTIVNRTGATITASSAGRWLDSLRVRYTTSAGQVAAADVPYRIVRLRGDASHTTEVGSSFDPGQWQEVLLETPPDAAPPPGVYRLHIEMAGHAFFGVPPRAKIRLTAWTPIEIRAVATLADELNVLHYKGITARNNGELARARSAFQEMLSQHPDSFVAWYEMSLTYVHEHRCTQAREALVRAQRLNASGADPDEWTAKNKRRTDLLGDLEQRIWRCRK